MNFLPSPTVCDHTHENAALSINWRATWRLLENLCAFFFHKYSFGRFLIVFWSAFCFIRAHCGSYDCYIFFICPHFTSGQLPGTVWSNRLPVICLLLLTGEKKSLHIVPLKSETLLKKKEANLISGMRRWNSLPLSDQFFITAGDGGATPSPWLPAASIDFRAVAGSFQRPSLCRGDASRLLPGVNGSADKLSANIHTFVSFFFSRDAAGAYNGLGTGKLEVTPLDATEKRLWICHQKVPS